MVSISKSWGSLFVWAVVVFSAIVEAVPAPAESSSLQSDKSKPKCKKILIRKAWQSLKKKEKLEYIDAVKCAIKKKGINKNAIGIDEFTIFEDFSFEHRKQTPYIHAVGHFLAWHRYFVHTFEAALREKCGYKGAQPYWDYALDWGKPLAQSSIWHPVIGFGGNGAPTDLTLPNPNAPGIPGFEYKSGGGCVLDGPFKDYIIRAGRRDNPAPEPRCIERAWNTELFEYHFSRARENTFYQQTTFEGFWRAIDPNPFTDAFPPGHPELMGFHASSHLVIGGTESDPFNSPSDPLFYLLHTNIDRVWRKWQAINPAVRHNEYGGNDIPPPFIQIPDPDPYGYSVKYVNITADYELTLEPLAPKITVKDVQDTTALCYDYDTTYVWNN